MARDASEIVKCCALRASACLGRIRAAAVSACLGKVARLGRRVVAFQKSRPRPLDVRSHQSQGTLGVALLKGSDDSAVLAIHLFEGSQPIWRGALQSRKAR